MLLSMKRIISPPLFLFFCDISGFISINQTNASKICAKLVLGLNKYDSATEALYTLHWLPIRARIEYKVICICHQCIHGNAPEYLKCLLQKVIIPRSLRNSSKRDMDLIIPFNRRKTSADRSLRTFGPRVWNPLPYEIKS